MVLLINLTPTCTELARHLVLSGINICLLDCSIEAEAGVSDKVVTEEDIESDFLCDVGDLGQKRCEVVKTKLSLMNPFVEIEFYDTASTSVEQIFSKAQQKSRRISVVIQGFDTWTNAA